MSCMNTPLAILYFTPGVYVHTYIYIACCKLFLLYASLDVNECELNIDDCDQLCVNDLGSYHCECYTGYFRETSSCVG